MNVELPTLETLTKDSFMKFIKSVNDLPVSVDFPRLFPLISVVDKDMNVLWEERKVSDNLVNNMLDFFLLIDRCLCVGKEEEIKNRYFDYIPKDSLPTNSDIPNGLKRFINEVLSEECPITSVLKCINQAIIVPAVTIVKMTFMKAKTTYFEIRGKWNITVYIKEDRITIHNRRWERSAPEAFNFCWDIDFILDREKYTLIDSKLQIADIVYIKEVSEESKQELIENLKGLYNIH